ncbi:hypothetical protein GPS53_04065 [Acinetobacter haemolyticus]|uniref:O-antigen polymerase n=1 Tax=Acinetobacter haemolyticus TaxID=29430 RepID=UPI00137359AB|nr:O-antigen polymerase [Acinetobacter haemolyticus]NAR82142.1 hypothetical protein [Acinetobacter haemolyticus]
MLFFSAISLTILTFLGFFVEYKNKSPFVIFFLALLLMSVFPTIIVAFGIESLNYKKEVYLEATLFSCLYLLSFIFFRILFVNLLGVKNVWRNFISNKEKILKSDIFLFLFLMLMCLVAFLKGLNINSIQAAFSLNWWDLVHGNSIVLLGTYLSYMSCGLLLLNYLYKGDLIIKRFTYGVVLFFLLFAVFILKTRSYVLMILIPLFVYFFFTKKGVELIKPLIFLVGMLFLFVLARAVRHSFDLNEFLEGDIKESLTGASEDAESTFINAFFYFVSKGNDFVGFEQNLTLKRILFFWFPEVKPIDFSYYMHSAYYGSSPSEGLSMHPTVYGDAYGNAWWFGAFLYSIFLSLYISVLEVFIKLIKYKKMVLSLAIFSIISTSALIFARGAIYNAFMFSFLPVFLFFIFYLVMDIFSKKDKSFKVGG